MQAIRLSVAEKMDLDRSVLDALERCRIVDSVTIIVDAFCGNVEIKQTPDIDPLEFYVSESSRLMAEVDEKMLREAIADHVKDETLIRGIARSIFKALEEIDVRQREYNNSLIRDISN